MPRISPPLKASHILSIAADARRAIKRQRNAHAPVTLSASDAADICEQALTKPVILLKEGVWQSWARDAGTFGSMASATAAIHFFGGSGYLYGIMGVVWFSWIVSRSMMHGKRNERTPQEALKFLAEQYPELHTPYDPDHQWSDVHEGFIHYILLDRGIPRADA